MSDRRQPAIIPPTTTNSVLNATQSAKKLFNLKKLPPAFVFMLFIQLSFVLAFCLYFRPAKRSIRAPSLKLGLSPYCRTSALPDWSERTRTFHANTKASFPLDIVFNWMRIKPIVSRLLAPSEDHGRHVHILGES